MAKAVVCFLLRGDMVVLAVKKRKIGAGCWNGFGGGLEEGETWKQAQIRELEQETGIVVDGEDLDLSAIMHITNVKSDNSSFVCELHVYLIRNWTGFPSENEEMGPPMLFQRNSLPFDDMMPADRVWLPPVLAGKKIIGTASYGPFQKNLIGDVVINEVMNLTDA